MTNSLVRFAGAGASVVMLMMGGIATGCTTTVVQAPAADGGATTFGAEVEAGAEPDAGDAGADAASPVACIATDNDCSGKASACCNGSTCVFDTKDPSKAVCAATCLKDSQCESGCCAVLIEGTQAVCSPAKYCAGSCAAPNQNCSTQTCCANSVCVTEETVKSCASRCATNAQCVSGCCAPLTNGDLVCSPVQYCL